jgi:FMN hydrolase / 5-amino-6-(5-phospho-D-ribitylamino)uracil phosphatase
VSDRRDLGARLHAVLLDYGGTLDGDAQHWFDHFVALYRDAGVTLPLASLKTAFYDADARLAADTDVRTLGLDAMVRRHVALQLSALASADGDLACRISDAFIADTRRAWDRNRPLLRLLSTRYRLGVVSNSYGNMPALLADADLARFAVVVDSEIEGVRKPDPAIYTIAAERLGVAPAAILHVGDSWERDVVAASAAGLHVAWLARADAPQPPEPPNVWRLASLLDLEALLA